MSAADTPASGVRDWDAETYDRVSAPQTDWGREVLDRLELTGDETVLDAGCGTGRVTALLLERLPRGRVIAVDASPSMVAEARAALPSDRTDVFEADLTALELEQQVDLAFSTAVFHWIADHDLLFARLHAALRPGGRLVAQCGGAGNVRRFHEVARAVGDREPFARYLAGWRGPWNFTAPEQASVSLERAGFRGVRCWLEDRPVRPPEPREFIRTVCLGHHLEALPEELRPSYVEAVYEGLGDAEGWETERLNIDARRPEIDYVRLNIDARKGDA